MKTITLKSGKEIELNQAFNMDCLEFMRLLPDKCIDLTVTSPPYDNLRTYNDSLEWNEDIWKAIIKDLYRITKDGGVVVWVVGDATINGSETGTSFKQALWAKECGFNLHDTMIYQKENYVPLSHNRYEQCFEYIFIFSKGKPKTFNPIKIPCKHPGKIEKYGQERRKTFGKNHSMRLYKETEYKKTNENKTSNNIFSYTVGAAKTGHPAAFPDKLAYENIISWSEKGDIVFDPFGGSFTTVIQSEKEKRKWLLCEKVKEYYELGYHRYEQETKQMLMEF